MHRNKRQSIRLVEVVQVCSLGSTRNLQRSEQRKYVARVGGVGGDLATLRTVFPRRCVRFFLLLFSLFSFLLFPFFSNFDKRLLSTRRRAQVSLVTAQGYTLDLEFKCPAQQQQAQKGFERLVIAAHSAASDAAS